MFEVGEKLWYREGSHDWPVVVLGRLSGGELHVRYEDGSVSYVQPHMCRLRVAPTPVITTTWDAHAPAGTIGQLQMPQHGGDDYGMPDFDDDTDDDLYRFTPDTEALLAVLLRPQGLTEQLAVAVLRAAVAGHRKEMLAAAAALADHVQEEAQKE